MRFGGVAVAMVLSTVTQAQGPISRTSGSGVVSPTVAATTIVAYPSPGQARLQLLVLWRGSPGWMTKGGHSSTGSGGRESGRSDEDYPLFSGMTYGDIRLSLSFRSGSHQLTIGNDDVPLGPEDNVVLVDDVDGSQGPQVLRTLHIDPDAAPAAASTPGAAPMATPQEFIRRSPELIAFVQCDRQMADSNGEIRQMITFLCGWLR
jgi:hypothetical protein